ncbi:MAG: RDD family protein [Anaeromyxobacteraceae bacterium]
MTEERSSFSQAQGGPSQPPRQAQPAPAPPQPQAAPPGQDGFPRPAGFWIRFLAMFVDGLVVWLGEMAVLVVLGIVGAVLGVFSKGGGEPGGAFLALFGLFYVVVFAGVWLYSALMESSAQQATLGKKALGLAVETADGRRLSFGRATGRFFAKILSAIPLELGFVVAAFTDRKRALHDYVAGTAVVQRRAAGTGGIVAAVLGGLFVLIAVAGIVAAIAIPNFVKHQLGAKRAEAPRNLGALALAERRHAEAGGGVVQLSIPADQTPGTAKHAWSAEDRALAAELGWDVEPATYFVYQVAAEQDEDGNVAWAACAEADLDGDGTVEAWAVFQPAMNDAGEPVLEPPEAPCAFSPALDREPVRGPEDPIGAPVRLSPADVY